MKPLNFIIIRVWVLTLLYATTAFADEGDIYFCQEKCEDSVLPSTGNVNLYLWIDVGEKGLGAYYISIQYELNFLSNALVDKGAEEKFSKPYFSKQLTEYLPEHGAYKYATLDLASYQSKSKRFPKNWVNPARIEINVGGAMSWEIPGLGNETTVKILKAEVFDTKGKPITINPQDLTLKLENMPIDAIFEMVDGFPQFNLTIHGPYERFRVYKDTTITFTPTSDNLIANLPKSFGNQWMDEDDVFADPDVNHYYRFTSVIGDYESPPSQAIGAYTLTVYPGANIFSIPIHGGTLLGSWDMLAQSWQGYFENARIYRYGAGSPHFDWAYGFGGEVAPNGDGITPRHIYLLLSTNETAQSVKCLGYTDDTMDFSHSLEPSDSWWKFLNLPGNLAALDNADSLAKNIGGVKAILKFNNKKQRWKMWFPEQDYGDNFSVSIAEPFVIAPTDSTPIEWPPSGSIAGAVEPQRMESLTQRKELSVVTGPEKSADRNRTRRITILKKRQSSKKTQGKNTQKINKEPGGQR